MKLRKIWIKVLTWIFSGIVIGSVIFTWGFIIFKGYEIFQSDDLLTSLGGLLIMILSIGPIVIMLVHKVFGDKVSTCILFIFSYPLIIIFGLSLLVLVIAILLVPFLDGDLTLYIWPIVIRSSFVRLIWIAVDLFFIYSLLKSFVVHLRVKFPNSKLLKRIRL